MCKRFIIFLLTITTSLSAQDSELDHRGFQTYTAKNLIFPLKQMISRAQIEEKKVVEAYRYIENTGWTYRELIAFRYSPNEWLIHWRTDGSQKGTRVGSKFLSEFDDPMMIENWLKIIVQPDIWNGLESEGDPSMDDGLRVVAARYKDSKFQNRIFIGSDSPKPTGKLRVAGKLAEKLWAQLSRIE
ncbi:hypothetical protein [Persicirhabdus sediminis]|uniref:Uncharacterized protein n=1 Tax=Persicirhabdus sediminis TaxID=454144 RepID=A0A8J7SKY2_9BACT|nr:hypothetical protein [Persicirhabdus sediminis]MBK1790053.1 hypothetical protein [Persicirhabdus sediminis]